MDTVSGSGCGKAGAIHAFDMMNHFFFISQMIVPGSSCRNSYRGTWPGRCKGDEEGLATMRTPGADIAQLPKKIDN